MKKVGIIGTGSWGSTISLLISKNVINQSKYFEKDVIIWGVKEEYEGRELTEIINNDHENKKYLPGIKLPENVLCTSDKSKFKDIDIIIVALPHQFIETLHSFTKYLKKDIVVVSAVKGLIEHDINFSLISDYINECWKCHTNVLMGANIATDVAKGLSGNIKYKSEGTLGYKSESDKDILFRILNCKMYKISCIKDILGVELCGTLKNVIALGYGISEGLGCSNNTKIAFLRNGLIEIEKFMRYFYPESKSRTLFESCGVADLIVSCQSGRNYKFGVAKASEGINLEEFEKRIGNQKIQGVGTVNCLYNFLIVKSRLEDFPIFLTVWKIFWDNEDCIKILESF